MGLNFRQFDLGVLRPTLQEIPIPSPEVAVKLVGETLFHESDRLHALGQYASWSQPKDAVFGPGLGIASIERPTWDWMQKAAIAKNAEFWKGTIGGYPYKQLAYDLRLNVVACRLRYFLDPMPLPELEDGIEARATYWWKIYNRGQVDRRPDYIANAKAIPWVRT